MLLIRFWGRHIPRETLALKVSWRIVLRSDKLLVRIILVPKFSTNKQFPHSRSCTFRKKDVSQFQFRRYQNSPRLIFVAHYGMQQRLQSISTIVYLNIYLKNNSFFSNWTSCRNVNSKTLYLIRSCSVILVILLDNTLNQTLLSHILLAFSYCDS